MIDDAIRKGKEGIPWTSSQTTEVKEDEWILAPEDNKKVGFWAEGEPELGRDEDYYGDDVTSLGHGELEQHRELREYARLIAWELPLLNRTFRHTSQLCLEMQITDHPTELARPFEPPTAATPFRFRYTSYLGESHPATNKVVVEFSAAAMKLPPTQRDKLIKLAGVRYNPSTDMIKMSCEQFDTQAQNKRFLGETITALLKEAKDTKDTFEDVPFDFRHHKPKPRYEFPKEWILTKERKQYLESKRNETLRLDDQKANNGHLIDGKLLVANSLPAAVTQPEMAMVGGPRARR